MSKHNIRSFPEPLRDQEVPGEEDESEDLSGSLWLIELMMDIFGGGTLNPPGAAQENPPPNHHEI